MEEFDIGRVLPLLIIWAVYWLINRRGKKHTEEQSDTGQAEVSRLPLEALEIPPLEYKAPTTVRTEPVYYHPHGQGRQTTASMSAMAPAAACRDTRTVSSHRNRANRMMLRRMIVWSEIIGQPVGLREKEERRV
jgi:hypothetical protein